VGLVICSTNGSSSSGSVASGANADRVVTGLVESKPVVERQRHLDGTCREIIGDPRVCVEPAGDLVLIEPAEHAPIRRDEDLILGTRHLRDGVVDVVARGAGRE
jgi:hypothetical protein